MRKMETDSFSIYWIVLWFQTVVSNAPFEKRRASLITVLRSAQTELQHVVGSMCCAAGAFYETLFSENKVWNKLFHRTTT